ncbi:MAG TPA: nuclear transport factor 2 family protein [Candidatus Cybelea sp.]|nr:nuclear transport factor 2 family protein [Candidatus Cybelea sp.]
MNSNIIETLLQRNLREVFNEQNGERRRAALKELYAEDAVFSDHSGRNIGHAAIDAAVAKLHERLPGFVLKERGEPQALEGAGRIPWQFGPANEPGKILGMDFITVKDGKIGAIYVFLDTEPVDASQIVVEQ